MEPGGRRLPPAATLTPVHSVAIRGAEVAVEQVGRGAENLVLVHGFQNDHTAWAPFVERLDLVRFTATSFDLVGCGGSSRPASWPRCTIAEYAADVAAICAELQLDDPVVIGHSLGGGSALQAALDGPSRFRALVLVAPVSTSGLDFLTPELFASLSHPTPQQQAELARAAFRHPPSEPELRPLLEVIARASPEHIEGAARSMRDFAVADELAVLDVPALLVCGDRDRHVPLRHHLATWQRIRRCGLQVYFDIGHVPFQETPDRFAEDVVRFLDAIG